MMPTLTYHPADAALAEQIQADLDDLSLPEDSSIVILSPPALADPEINAAILRAVQRQQHIVPVLAQPTPLPKLIEHLDALDFSQGYDREALADNLAAGAASMPMKQRTPDVIAANRRVGLVVAAAALVVFVAALYGVGVMGIQAPLDEYATVDANVILTRNAIIDGVLPHSTEDAANFQATFDAAAPTLRPILAATVTAQAVQ
jgi:hypothetical protein